MRIPVFVLTGFLGSGKTTVLNQCLAGRRFSSSAVLINEIGEVGLDHLLVETVDDEVVVLESGCVCCSIRNDFTTALLDLAHRSEDSSIPAFNRVVLETTGIADPNAVHQALINDEQVRKRYRYAGTVTVIDGVFGMQTLQQHPEAVLQASVADAILVSKTDIASDEGVRSVVTQVETLNPNASMHIRDVELADVLMALEQNTNSIHQLSVSDFASNSFSDRHGHRFHTFRISLSEEVPWERLKAWLEALLFARGDDVYRVKGWANVVGESMPVVIQGVNHALYPPQHLSKWPSDRRRTVLTFICRNFTQSAATTSLAQAGIGAEAAVELPSKALKTTGARKEGPLARTVEIPEVLAFLKTQLSELSHSVQQNPWIGWALHNPWSLASTRIDSWGILDACLTPKLLDAVAEMLGPDIVLFDTCLQPVLPVPNEQRDWRNDLPMFPVDPASGAVVRLRLGPSREPGPGREIGFSFREGNENPVGALAEQVVVHDASLDYRYRGGADSNEGYEFVARYFPATSRFIRDAESSAQRELMERFPLLNYANAPVWLAAGTDRSDNDFVTGFQPKSGYWLPHDDQGANAAELLGAE